VRQNRAMIVKIVSEDQQKSGSRAFATLMHGRLCLHRKRINISTVLAGQKLGIK
jgi:hypothetical protein